MCDLLNLWVERIAVRGGLRSLSGFANKIVNSIGPKKLRFIRNQSLSSPLLARLAVEFHGDEDSGSIAEWPPLLLALHYAGATFAIPLDSVLWQLFCT